MPGAPAQLCLPPAPTRTSAPTARSSRSCKESRITAQSTHEELLLLSSSPCSSTREGSGHQSALSPRPWVLPCYWLRWCVAEHAFASQPRIRAREHLLSATHGHVFSSTRLPSQHLRHKLQQAKALGRNFSNKTSLPFSKASTHCNHHLVFRKRSAAARSEAPNKISPCISYRPKVSTHPKACISSSCTEHQVPPQALTTSPWQRLAQNSQAMPHANQGLSFAHPPTCVLLSLLLALSLALVFSGSFSKYPSSTSPPCSITLTLLAGCKKRSLPNPLSCGAQLLSLLPCRYHIMPYLAQQP